MMKRAIFFLTQLLFLSSAFSQTLSFNTSAIKYELSGVPVYTSTSFNPLDPKYNLFKYFICLDDGTYDYGGGKLQSLVTNSGITTGTLHINIPPNSTSQTTSAKIQYTAVYDNDDKPKLKTFSPGTGGTDLQSSYAPLVKQLAPRKGDTVLYALNLRKCNEEETSGGVRLEFNPADIKILHVYNPYPSVNYYPDPADPTNPAFYHFNFNSLNSGSRNVFLEIEYLTTASNPFTFYVHYGNSDEDFSPCQTDTISSEMKAAGNPHDPNLIESDNNLLCIDTLPDKPHDYRIIFQNIGTQHTDGVTVKLYLPDCFKHQTGTISVTEPSSSLPTTLTGNRGISWRLTKGNGFLKRKYSSGSFGGNSLRGTNETPKTFSEDETKDTIRFTAQFDPTENATVLPCSKIPIWADIYFDGITKPVITDEYFLDVLCNISCKLCEGPVDFSPLDTVMNGSFLDLNLSSTSGLEVIWYPFYGLDDPRSFKPKATPNKNMTYYASVVELAQCQRQLFKVVVLKSGGIGLGWYWLVIGAVVLIGGTLIIWLFRR